MEGYSNVNVNLHNFDDLDIEGRIVDDWDQEDFTGPQEDDHKRVLETKVRLDDGTYGEMCSVVKKQHGFSYTCFVCTVTCAGWEQFKEHLGSAKHINYMRIPEHPRNKFVKLDPNENMALVPGEPVPPGLEDIVIPNCKIQSMIDSYTSGPLIGLEYLVELSEDFENDLDYHCLLCEKIGKGRSILNHMTSQGHYKKYIQNFFKGAYKLYNDDLPRNSFYRKRCSEIVIRIAKKIETKYGRLKPRLEKANTFPMRKASVLQEIETGIHIREGPDDRFDDCLLVTDPSPVSLDHSGYSLSKVEKVEPKTEKSESKDLPPSDVLKDTKDKVDLTLDDGSKSLFNKGKINADKRNIRSRDGSKDGRKSSSPEIIGVEIVPPGAKKVKQSESISSISFSSESRSRSRSRSRTKFRDRPQQKSRDRSPYKSRGRSPRRTNYRPRSYNRSYGRHSRRSRSPSVNRRHQVRSQRSRSRGRNRSRSSSLSRSPVYFDRFGRTVRKRLKVGSNSRPKVRKQPNERYNDEELLKDEKRKWEKFREEFQDIEKSLFEKLKHFEKNPEKHPQYPEEWKIFWNKRYKEIQSEGKDPAKHDFKPEWIVVWNKRMKEFHEEELKKRKDILREKFDLPLDCEPKVYYGKDTNCNPVLFEDVSPPTPEKKDAIADVKNTWKALTGSDIKESKRPLSPWEEEMKPADSRFDHRGHRQHVFVDNAGSVVALLRKLAVLESYLGSLGPKVLELLSKALTMDKISENGSEAILKDNEHCVFLETVKEKLKGLIFAGVVARNLVNTTKASIKTIDKMMAKTNLNEMKYSSSKIEVVSKPTIDPVVVPGVGKVDKVAIAQQIAAALIQQGRTNVTEDELEQLINAVVGMAEASTTSAQPITAAKYVSQMQLQSESNMKSAKEETPIPSALTLLQSAYSEAAAKPEEVNKIKTDKIDSKVVNKVEDLNEADLKNVISTINDLTEDEKCGLGMFVKNLESSSTDMINKLQPSVPSEISTSIAPPAKRSPIVIPISKEKSLQKIKPVDSESGRLSPFSMRSGGINPSADAFNLNSEQKSDGSNNIINNPSTIKEQVLIANFDEDDNDDDDDYSVDDVYKAASEKLRLKEIEEEKNNLSEKTKIVEVIELAETNDNHKTASPDLPTLEISKRTAPPEKCEYQVNLNNYTQFASAPTSAVSATYPNQENDTSLDFKRFDGESYSINQNVYPKLDNYQSHPVDPYSAHPPVCSQSGYPTPLNAQLNPKNTYNHQISLDSENSYSNYNQQSSQINNPHGVDHHNSFPNRMSNRDSNILSNQNYPGNFQTFQDSSNRSQYGNYSASYDSNVYDQTTNFPSSENNYDQMNYITNKYSDNNRTPMYPQRQGNRFPYGERSSMYPIREDQDHFHPNHYYKPNQIPPNHQVRYSNNEPPYRN